jgi:hypothetical protein
MFLLPFGNAQPRPMFLMCRRGLAVVTTPRRPGPIVARALSTATRRSATLSHLALRIGLIYGVDHI